MAVEHRSVRWRYPAGHPQSGFPDDVYVILRLLLMGPFCGLFASLAMLWIQVVHAGMDNVFDWS